MLRVLKQKTSNWPYTCIFQILIGARDITPWRQRLFIRTYRFIKAFTKPWLKLFFGGIPNPRMRILRRPVGCERPVLDLFNQLRHLR